jgi:voltage-gated potassium channel
MKPRPDFEESEYLREMRRKVQFLLIVLLAINGMGIIGNRILEHCTWTEALYKTVCVLSTLGLNAHPTTPFSTIFTVVLALAGIGTAAYAASAIVREMVSEDFQRSIERRKVMRRMQKVTNHYIICGFGRIGEIVTRHLHTQALPYVIIERDETVFGHIEHGGQMGVCGDAAHDGTLERAGLARARGLIAVTASDAENVLITMTARQLNPKIPIVVRCDQDTNRVKFMRAGATRVITLNSTGAAQIALAATKPYVIDLIDLAIGTGNQEFELRQVLVPEGSFAHGQTLKDLSLGSRFGIIIIGIKSHDQEMQFNPSAHARLSAGDIMITVGREEKFRELEVFLAGKKISSAALKTQANPQSWGMD